jgi:hypothetical protein
MIVYLSSLVLNQKKQKFKALTSYATNYKLRLNHLNLPMPAGRLAALKQQMIFNASTYNLLNATKFKALASLIGADSQPNIKLYCYKVGRFIGHYDNALSA